jgi:tetratricopeptide (TPR) repeat protein
VVVFGQLSAIRTSSTQLRLLYLLPLILVTMIKIPCTTPIHHLGKAAKCMIILCSVFASTSLHAQVPADGDGEKKEVMIGMERQGDALLDFLFSSVEGLSKPRIWEDAIRVPIEVTTTNHKAREYSRQGFGLMQCGWDIEAHRSFVHALKYDPDCLLAYTGLLYLSATNHNPSHEVKTYLMERVDTLSKSKKDEDYAFKQQERLYGELAISTLEGNKDSQLDVLDQLVKSYPLDFQALISKKVLLRVRSGAVTDDEQQEKKQYIGALMNRYKYTPMLWIYWILLHDYETDQGVIASQVLPVVNKLTVWAPDIPTFVLKKGYFLRKAGQFKEADIAFNKAEKIYADWGEQSKIPEDMNAGLWQSRIFRAVNYFDMGEFDKAIKLAVEMAKTEIDVSHKGEMRGIFLWEVKTLASRLYLARGNEGDFEKARDALPTKEFKASVEKISAVTLYYQGLNEYIAIRILLRDGRINDAIKIQARMAETLGKLHNQRLENSDQFIDKNYFFRGYMALRIYFEHSNALMSLLSNDKDSYESLIQAVREKLDIYSSLSVLPRHVMQKF